MKFQLGKNNWSWRFEFYQSAYGYYVLELGFFLFYYTPGRKHVFELMGHHFHCGPVSIYWPPDD